MWVSEAGGKRGCERGGEQGSPREPPLRPDFFLLPAPATVVPLSLSSSLFLVRTPCSPRSRTPCWALRYLQIQIPGSLGAITQPLESGPLELGPLPLARRASLTSFSVKALLPQHVCNGPPTPGKPRWVSNTYLHSRGTTVSRPADPVHTQRPPPPIPSRPTPSPPPPQPPSLPLYSRRHAGRTKFIPPNDFITLPRTFNMKLLLRPDSDGDRVTGRGQGV